MFSSWFSKAAAFPYELKEQVANFETVGGWTLHAGVRKSDRKAVSILSFDVKKNAAQLPLATNAFKRMKTLRHPNLLPFLDGVEQEGVAFHLVTEEVMPLEAALPELRRYPHALSWGLHQIIKALSFVTDNGLTHGNVGLGAVLVSKQGGDWKLAALEFVSARDDPASPLRTFGATLMPAAVRPPELAKQAWQMLEQAPPYAVDSWMLACLIYELYNGKLSRTEDLKKLGDIPKSLVGQYQQLLSSNPSARLNPALVLSSDYFNNVVVETCQFLEQITLKDQYEKDKFFRKLESHVAQLPENLCKYKVLPQLVTALDFGGASSAVIAPLLHMARSLNEQEYAQQITPSVVKWFATPNRELRLNLLQQLPEFVHHLPPALVNDSIFPSVAAGFDDQSPVLREATLKSMLHFVPKLAERTVTTQVLKWLAKLQMDTEPGLRTNTTICLAKLAPHLAPATRTKILAAAFGRAVCDPFGKARVAGLMAMQETQAFYGKHEIALKLVPAIAPLTIDPEAEVRDEAFKAIKLFVAKLERIAAHGEEQEAARQPDAASASMLGWALSSLSSSISKKILGDASKTADVRAGGPAEGDSASSTVAASSSSNKSAAGAGKSGGATQPQQQQQPATAAAGSKSAAGPGPARAAGKGGWSDDEGQQAELDEDDGDGWDDADFAAVAKPPKSSSFVAAPAAASPASSSSSSSGSGAGSARRTTSTGSGLSSPTTPSASAAKPRQQTQQQQQHQKQTAGARSSSGSAGRPVAANGWSDDDDQEPAGGGSGGGGWDDDDDDDFFSSAAKSPVKTSSKLERPKKSAAKTT